MDIATAQVIISQYCRGVLNGCSPNSASEASGLLHEYYLQGFEDGRNGTRKAIAEKKIIHLDDQDPQGVALVRKLREVYSKIDLDADPPRVYSKLMSGGQLILDQASKPQVVFGDPSPVPAAADTLPGEPSAEDVERAQEILRRAGR